MDITSVFHEISGIYNVMNFGAVGNGTTDDTAAIQAAHDAMPAGGGRLYFPAATYKITDTIDITKPCTIYGDGSGDVYLLYSEDGTAGQPDIPNVALSRIAPTMTNLPAFAISAYPVHIEKLDFKYAGTTPSAGNCALKFTGGYNSRVRDITVFDFYDGIRVEDDMAEYLFDGVGVGSPHRYGIYCNNATIPDYGDQSITNCWIKSGGRDATAAIKIEGGGGCKILNLKVNASFNPDASIKKFAYGVDFDNVAGQTVDFLMSNCSIENFSHTGVRVRGVTAAMYDVALSNLQISPYVNTTGPAVKVESVTNVVISNILGKSSGNSNPVVQLTSVTRAKIANINNEGYASELAQSGSSSVSVATYS